MTEATIALLDEVFAGAGAPRGVGVTAAAAHAPFLLWVHYIDPHYPYAPPESWRDQPPGRKCRDLVTRAGADLVAAAHVMSDVGGEASAALADCEAMYDAEIAYTDFQIGRLLAALEARELLAVQWMVGLVGACEMRHDEIEL